MQVTINRQEANRLYTEGTLLINGRITTHTVESTQEMLPAGHYILKIVKHSERKQSLYIFCGKERTPWTIGIAPSWKVSRKKSIIAIGEPLIPGIVYQATPVYERLIDRLSKCMERKETIHLHITQEKCNPSHVIKHWQNNS